MLRTVKLFVFLAKFNGIWEMKKKIGIRDMRVKMKGIWDMNGPVSLHTYVASGIFFKYLPRTAAKRQIVFWRNLMGYGRSRKNRDMGYDGENERDIGYEWSSVTPHICR